MPLEILIVIVLQEEYDALHQGFPYLDLSPHKDRINKLDIKYFSAFSITFASSSFKK